MLTQEQVLDAIKGARCSPTIDGRDLLRLANFFPASDLEAFGLSLKEGATWEPKPWTRDAVLEQLREDVAFGFEKALGRRGISSGLMAVCVQMWMWVLEERDPEEEFGYAQYGLPMFKGIALRYGFPNPIGDDTGTEHKYSMEDDR
jgi:hypothetical protein